jgi:hypothetical protein
VPVYALVTALLPEASIFDLSADRVDNNGRAATREHTLRVVCAVLIVVGLDWVEDSVHDLARISNEVYDQDGDAFALRVLNYVEHHLPELEGMLDQWILRVSIELADIDDAHTKDRLRQARMAYGFARYQALKRLEEAGGEDESARDFLRRELIWWMRAIDDTQSAREWADTLVCMLEAEGKSKQVARTIFQEGHKLFFDGHHEESANRFRQSLQLAERIGDKALMRECEQYLGYADFFLGQEDRN